jgi:hypothetical protein
VSKTSSTRAIPEQVGKPREQHHPGETCPPSPPILLTAAVANNCHSPRGRTSRACSQSICKSACSCSCPRRSGPRPGRSGGNMHHFQKRSPQSGTWMPSISVIQMRDPIREFPRRGTCMRQGTKLPRQCLCSFPRERCGLFG